MTKEQLVQELLDKELSEWLPVEIDGFIVDAYLSLLKSLRGKLYTSGGLLVEPDMNIWGNEKDDEDGVPTTCVACLAGAFFVGKVGCLIPDLDKPYPFEAGVSKMNVLRFLDGLRYLGVDDDDGEAIGQLLRGMGYLVPEREGYEYNSSQHEEDVANKLQRFIDLNPQLTDRIRVATTKGEGV